MKKRLRMKFALICLVAFVFPNVFQVGVLAAGNGTSNDQPLEIISTAGMNGYYEYNAYTKEETFVPVSEYAPVSKGNTGNLIQYRMYRTTGSVTGDESMPITRYLPVVGMDIDTERGQSGSPVYRNISGRGNCAQAIVISETYQWGEPLYNSAILINDWLYNAMTT